MRMLPIGPDAVLVEVSDLAEVMALHARLTAAPPAGIVDVVPAAATVLVRVDPVVLSLAATRTWVSTAATSAAPPASAPAPVTLPIRYDGDDLDDLAAALGFSPEALAARHVATDWTVAFTGFAPGFGYLVGAGWDLDIPRRPSPRTRVPAGSVGLAGVFSGAYPRETPGGWQLIGTTDAPLFDPDAAQPALLVPGGTVRFDAVRARARARARAIGSDAALPGDTASPTAGEPRARSESATAPGGIRVIAPGPQATVQDAGRSGRAAEGVGAAGAADPAAWALANRLVGNRDGAAAIEIAVGGFRAVAERDLTVVVTGAWAPVAIDGRTGDPYVVHAWTAGTELRLDGFLAGTRAYLAVRGGWDIAPVLGSRSTDTLSGLGPPPLRRGDVVAAGCETAGPVPALPLHPWGLPPTGTDAVPLDIPFTTGPRADWLTPSSRRLLAEATWIVSAAADRVGIRLEGPRLERARGEELASEGMVPGAIQVPPAGHPVVFGVDAPVTGGYPVVGVVTSTGRNRLAQARPGDRVRLRPTFRGASDAQRG
ncbi:allophanate hydrolase [Microbacterium sp. SGAir0570]|uniref:5-oxoprolinase subunit B/C family protein n=1 Tax=Microbacterium sp. SGAir0570 TaxID=2070348 RepID=UPI0010CCD1A1|nr:carboxyltransferase domain-containing protein [Microbacterium sp. SGAir0570]QCR41455.1 allophanate hydrolase [Microbacterium sp. SGAir0570]